MHFWLDVTQQNISDTLHKLEVSRKKERDEFKHQAFAEPLKTKSRRQVVYVDEVGIDNRHKYPFGYCSMGQSR